MDPKGSTEAAITTKAHKIVDSAFYDDIKNIIVGAQTAAIRSVDFQRVLMYWHLGERIFVEEQRGEDRAEYGEYLIRDLSMQLEAEFGSGFSRRQLERGRRFYRTYPIASALRTQLNWMQYKLLVAIDDASKREYYELETANNAWTGREMERQINSLLYERLLRCFVVIEIKTHKATHEDLGQLQMYVNYFDRHEKLPDENPTVGILLCTAKNDTLVKITLPENTRILASQYQLYLPSEHDLKQEIEKERKLVEERLTSEPSTSTT